MIFDVCESRADVLAGAVESNLAADLAHLVRGNATDEYAGPRRPGAVLRENLSTAGLRDLRANDSGRLSGTGGELAAIFRLDTSCGSGKTKGLIALAHAADGDD